MFFQFLLPFVPTILRVIGFFFKSEEDKIKAKKRVLEYMKARKNRPKVSAKLSRLYDEQKKALLKLTPSADDKSKPLDISWVDNNHLHIVDIPVKPLGLYDTPTGLPRGVVIHYTASGATAAPGVYLRGCT